MEQVNLLEHPAPAVGGHSLVDDLHGVLHLVHKKWLLALYTALYCTVHCTVVISTVHVHTKLTLFGRCVAAKSCHVFLTPQIWS